MLLEAFDAADLARCARMLAAARSRPDGGADVSSASIAAILQTLKVVPERFERIGAAACPRARPRWPRAASPPPPMPCACGSSGYRLALIGTALDEPR